MLDKISTSYQPISYSEIKKDSTVKSLGKDEFLKLLITELKNQNPLEPLDSKEYIAQLATFSQVEQIQEMRKELSVLSSINLIGKRAKATYEEKVFEGEIKGVVFDKSEISVILGDDEAKIPISNINEIR